MAVEGISLSRMNKLNFLRCESWQGEIDFQDDRKVTQPIPDTCSICQKINYTNHKTKNNVILNVENVHRVQRRMHSLFSSCLMQPSEEFLCHRNGSPDDILSICLAQENREMYP
jgi:hypothetical protein